MHLFPSLKERYTEERLSKSDIIVDLCSGSGVVGILAQAKTGAKNLIMIEKQKALFDMCKKSLEINNLTQKAKVFCADIVDAPHILKNEIGIDTVDVVCVNPPYYLQSQKKLSNKYEIDIAKFEITLSLKSVCEVASKILKFGGKFFMINDSDRISEIISTLKFYGLEPKILEFVFPKALNKSNVVLIEAVKGGKPNTKVYYKNI